MATTTPAESAALEPASGTGDGRAARSALSRIWQRNPELFAELRGFAVVAVICTVVSMLIFAALRHPMGTQWANVVSLMLCSVLNTELNRRISFGLSGWHLWWRDQRRGLWVMLLALAMTSGSLWLLHDFSPHASIAAELVVITLGNVASAITRFVLLRYWIFRRVRKDRAAA